MIMNTKGRAVYTNRPFTKGEFICEYNGELIDCDEAKLREAIYAEQNKGSFMFYFQYKRKMWYVEVAVRTVHLMAILQHRCY